MMRGFGLVLALLLTGCTLASPQAKAPAQANPITGDAVEVTTLAMPPEGGMAAAGRPGSVPVEAAKLDPGKVEAGKVDPAEPPPTKPAAPPEVVEIQPLSSEELACLKKGGTWSGAGFAGAKACVKLTRDGGKSCKREKDCEGYCLAKSKTCAPVTPMFGCNEIVQDNGMVVTLCID